MLQPRGSGGRWSTRAASTARMVRPRGGRLCPGIMWRRQGRPYAAHCGVRLQLLCQLCLPTQMGTISCPPASCSSSAGTDFYRAQLVVPSEAYEMNFVFGWGEGAWVGWVLVWGAPAVVAAEAATVPPAQGSGPTLPGSRLTFCCRRAAPAPASPASAARCPPPLPSPALQER